MAAVGIVPGGQNNPATGNPLGPGFVAGAGAVTGTAALGTPLPAAGPVTVPAPIPPLALPIASTAALGLTGVGPHFTAVPAAAAGGTGDPWVAAYNKAKRLQAYMSNSMQVGEKANEFRTLIVDRLRAIYWRLQSIQAAAGAANQAQQALITLVDTINAAGGPTDAQNAAMHDLAAELQNINIPNMITGLVNEINNLANQVGLVAGQKVANDTSLIPMTGGRRRRKKKSRKKGKRKGGYKFTRAANSRRSLRMKTRKRRSRRRRRKHRRRSRHKRR